MQIFKLNIFNGIIKNIRPHYCENSFTIFLGHQKKKKKNPLKSFIADYFVAYFERKINIKCMLNIYFNIPKVDITENTSGSIRTEFDVFYQYSEMQK